MASTPKGSNGQNLFKRKRWIANALALALVIMLILGLAGTVEAVLHVLKVSGSMVAGGDVSQFALSPNGKYAVFIADARVNTIPELFSVPAWGGARIALSPPLAEGWAVLDFAISPNSQSVVYWTGLVADSRATNLYVVPINGSAAAQLLVTSPATYWLTDMAVSSNSLWVVYLLNRAEGFPAIQQTLFSAPLAGGSPVQLSEAFCGTICTYIFKITPDGTKVIYRFNPPVGPITLWRVDMAGTSAENLDEDIRDFDITPDGDYVVYEKSFNGLDNDLYAIPSGGGTAIKLNGALIAGKSVLDFKISPNSQVVVYRADELVDGRDELFSVPVVGPATSRKVLVPAWANANGDVAQYQILPNNLGVVYTADEYQDEKFELMGVTMDGLHEYVYSGFSNPFSNVTSFAVAPNSLGVVFIQDASVDEKFELYASAIDASTTALKLSPSLAADRDVLDFLITPNSAGVVYRADPVTDEYYNLYLVPSTGGTSVRLNDALPVGGDVSGQYAVTSDSQGVVYLADQVSDGVDELFSVFDRKMIFLPVVVK